MTRRFDRSLSPFSRRDFLKTTALAGITPLAFAQANQDEEKPKAGRLYAFVSERNFSPEQTDPAMTGMFAIDPESGVWERVATTKQVVNWYLSSISPQDGTIAVSPMQTPPNKGVWIFDPSREVEPKRIIDKVTATVVRPLWSSDGKRLLVTFSLKGREKESAFETLTFRRDGTEVVKLPLAETDLALAWSPNDLSLLVASAKDREPVAIAVREYSLPIEFVNIDGTGRRRLVDAQPNHLLVSANFSPDGLSFSYIDVKIQPNRVYKARLSIVDIETGKRRRLLEDEDDPSTVRWSIDGKTLAKWLGIDADGKG